MIQWSYREIMAPEDSEMSLMERLDWLGKEGWEAVHVYPDGGRVLLKKGRTWYEGFLERIKGLMMAYGEANQGKMPTVLHMDKDSAWTLWAAPSSEVGTEFAQNMFHKGPEEVFKDKKILSMELRWDADELKVS